MARKSEPPAAHVIRDEAAEMIDPARATEDSIQRLCRATLHRTTVKPAEVDLVLAHLAAAVAALPQVASQLADILGQAKDEYTLATDSLLDDPDTVIDTARLHLERVHEPAIQLYRLLDAAHNETAHLSVTDRPVKPAGPIAPDVAPLARRRDEDRPWPAPGRRSGPPLSR